MLRKVIEYEDYEGVLRKETFIFNINESELMQMELGTTGTFTKKIMKLQESLDTKEIMNTFEYIIGKAYGKLSDDGKRLMKSEEISKEFFESPAWNVLFMELFRDSEYAAKFIKEILPKQPEQSIPAPPVK